MGPSLSLWERCNTLAALTFYLSQREREGPAMRSIVGR
jgi:hypothetical protein